MRFLFINYHGETTKGLLNFPVIWIGCTLDLEGVKYTAGFQTAQEVEVGRVRAGERVGMGRGHISSI